MTFLERFTKNPNTVADSAPSELVRRHFARHPSRQDLWIEADERLVEVRALNVSLGGLAFQTRWALARDSTIQVGSERQVQAVVRYCVDNGDGTATCGAEFAPKTVSELQAIEAILQSLEAKVQQ